MIAVARLFFDNVKPAGSWLTTGKDIGQLTLHLRADGPGLGDARGERRLLGRGAASVQT